MTRADIRGRDGTILDRCLVAYFPGPASYTGEDCAELHVHGGYAVVDAVLRDLRSRPDHRDAEPGEFSRRSLANGKLDLTDAEALGDLIEARTEAQRRLALRNYGGGHTELYRRWREALVHARAMLEAEIDFSDEDDVPGSISARIWQDLGILREEIRLHLQGYQAAELVRNGFRVALLGPPNAGKSSLLNTLARRDVAIVSEEPGTTRDPIEVELDLDGSKIIVTDTAGLRNAGGQIELEGMRRARRAASDADVVLWLCEEPDTEIPALNGKAEIIRVLTKSDLAVDQIPSSDLSISSLTGEGIGDLLAFISKRARGRSALGSEPVAFTPRHVEELVKVMESLSAAMNSSQVELELRVEDLRSASRAIERLSGEIGIEDVLDVIFSRFCIGK